MGSSGSPAVPEGFEELEVGIVRITVPEELQEIEAQEGDYWEVIYQDVPAGASDDATTQLVLNPEMAGAISPMDGLSRYLNVAQFGAFENFQTLPMADRPSWEQEVDAEQDRDSEHFLRHRYTWEGPDGTPYEAITWGLHDGATTGAVVQYASSEFDEEIARAFDASIELQRD